jgi:hypothetical protein
MLSPELSKEWRQRLDVALKRYEEAKRRVGETAVERLDLPSPDGFLAHRVALEQETESLREYRNLLAAYAALLADREPPK